MRKKEEDMLMLLVKDIQSKTERIERAIYGNGSLGIKTKLNIVWYAIMALSAVVIALLPTIIK